MTNEEWLKIQNDVTDAMRRHTRPFVTPLTASDEDKVVHVGTGSYVHLRGARVLLTCEPVHGYFFDIGDPREWSPHPGLK